MICTGTGTSGTSKNTADAECERETEAKDEQERSDGDADEGEEGRKIEDGQAEEQAKAEREEGRRGSNQLTRIVENPAPYLNVVLFLTLLFTIGGTTDFTPDPST